MSEEIKHSAETMGSGAGDDEDGPDVYDPSIFTTNTTNTSFPTTDSNLTTETTVLPTTTTTTTTTPSSVPDGGSDDDDDQVFLIICVVGSVALLCLLLLLCCWCRRRLRKKKKPPELPHPHRLTRMTSGEPIIHFRAEPHRVDDSDRQESTSSTQGHLQIVSYKPLHGEALLPPSKKSSPRTFGSGVSTRDSESRSGASGDIDSSIISLEREASRNVYNNDEVVRASATNRNTVDINCGGGDSPPPPHPHQEPLYVQPDSLQMPNFDIQSKNYPSAHNEGDDVTGSLDRSRLDSQKYLLPAQLILKLPKDMRKASIDSMGKMSVNSLSKMSVDSLSGDGSGKSPADNGLNMRWKASPPIIHAAEGAPDPTNTTYVCMDLGGQGVRPATSTSSCPPPTPCKSPSSRPDYINLQREEPIPSPPSLQSPTSSNVYEPVSALQSSDVYKNADEILQAKRASLNETERDSYVMCNLPQSAPAGFAEKEEGDASIFKVDDNTYVEQSQTRTDLSSVSCSPTIEPTDRNSTGLSYVNVAEFQKMSPGCHDNAESNHSMNAAPGSETSHEPNSKSLAGDTPRPKKSSKPKPATAKKPTKPAKPKSYGGGEREAASTGTLADLGRAVRKSLILKTKGLLGTYNINNSSSTPDLTPRQQRDVTRDLSSDKPKRAVLSQHKKFKERQKFTSEPSVQTDQASAGPTPVTENKLTEDKTNSVYGNLMSPDSSSQGMSFASRSSLDALHDTQQTADRNQKMGAVHKNRTLGAPTTGQKTPFKKGSVSQNVEKLDISELRSKLRKTTKS